MDNTQTVNEKALEAFVDELIQKKSSPLVTDENRDDVRQMLMNDILQAINAHLVSLLSDEQVEELNQMLDRGASDDELNTYFTQQIPETQEEIAKALVNFRDAYLSVDYSKETLEDIAAGESTESETPSEHVSPPPPPAPVSDEE